MNIVTKVPVGGVGLPEDVTEAEFMQSPTSPSVTSVEPCLPRENALPLNEGTFRNVDFIANVGYVPAFRYDDALDVAENLLRSDLLRVLLYLEQTAGREWDGVSSQLCDQWNDEIYGALLRSFGEARGNEAVNPNGTQDVPNCRIHVRRLRTYLDQLQAGDPKLLINIGRYFLTLGRDDVLWGLDQGENASHAIKSGGTKVTGFPLAYYDGLMMMGVGYVLSGGMWQWGYGDGSGRLQDMIDRDHPMLTEGAVHDGIPPYTRVEAWSVTRAHLQRMERDMAFYVLKAGHMVRNRSWGQKLSSFLTGVQTSPESPSDGKVDVNDDEVHLAVVRALLRQLEAGRVDSARYYLLDGARGLLKFSYGRNQHERSNLLGMAQELARMAYGLENLKPSDFA